MDLKTSHNSPVIADPLSTLALPSAVMTYTTPNSFPSSGLYLNTPRKKPLPGKIEEVRAAGWLDLMLASSPPRKRQTKDFANDVQADDLDLRYRNWMVKYPSALTSFEAITDLAGGKRLALFLDYDGTLSPIVDNPENAVMSDEMRAAVRHVASLFPTAIISGRSRDKVFDFVELTELYYAGSHGMDIMGPVRKSESNGHHVECIRSTDSEGKEVNLFQPASEFLPMIGEVFKNLSESIKDIDGARMEDNKFCVSVHFRNVAPHEGVAVGRTFASLKDYQVDGNKEMMAIGLMNIVGSCTSCYVTTGAFSRSAVNHNAGCKTAMSNVIMALTVMVTLLFLMPLFVYTPNVVLGAIIIAAVIGLIDLPTAYHIWKMDKMDFLVCLCAFAGVIFISVQEGLAIAVGISIFRVLLQVTRPKMMIQGNIKGTDIYRNLHQYKEAQRVPGFLILALEAPINFANTNYLNERIKRWIEEENPSGNKQTELHFVILDLSAVPAIDTSGIAFLTDIKKSIEKRGLELVLVNPTGEVMEKIQRANDADNHFRSDCLYLTTGEAIASLSAFDKMTTP